MTESNKRAFADLNTMDRLAYDLGAEFGSDSLSDASYNADVDIIYCSLFCGTQNALNEYINKRAIEGGNCTRKIVTRIDEEILGEDAPQFRPQTPEEQRIIDEMVDRLMAETYNEEDLLQPVHEIPMAWMETTVKRWCHEQRMVVLKTGSRAHNCFYKRASVSAWRLTCMLYHLWCMEEGQDRVQQACTRFYKFMAQYILDGLLTQWGRQYDEMHKHDDDVARSPVTSLYDQVPHEFTRDQLQELCAKLGLSPARIFLHKWKKAKLIHQKEKGIELFMSRT